MNVKGTAIKTTRDFVNDRFKLRFNEWLDQMPAESKKLYTGSIEIGKWFPVKPAYYDPMDKIVQLFYNGNYQKAGDDLGKYSAEVALKGIYKVFLLVATPQYLMKKAANMMQAYYEPSEIEITDSSNHRVVFKIKKFEKITKCTEYRIAGWCVKALELCNCKNAKYRFLNHISSGNTETTIEFTWE
jgi:hypothetical protein